MADSKLNQFLASGTNAERVAFTPTPPTPASGPDSGYFFFETDTNNAYAWDSAAAAWVQVNTTLDAELTAIAGLTSAADKLPYFTGSGTAALADFTAAGRALMDDAAASDQRTTLGLGTGALLVTDTDNTLAADSDLRVATQKAVKAHVAAAVAAGVSDGDKGDVVVSGTGTVWALDTTGVAAATYVNATVTLDAKGRATAATSENGTGFPGSPAAGDRFWRTDRNIYYFYDGTRWLSVQQFTLQIQNTEGALPTAATLTNAGRATAPWTSTYDLYIEKFEFAGIVGGATNNGTNFWTADLRKGAAGASSTNSISSVNTSAGVTGSQFFKLSSTPNVLLGTTNVILTIDLTKTLSPNNLFWTAFVQYRLVG
jgi:hypothetical protein